LPVVGTEAAHVPVAGLKIQELAFDPPLPWPV
jgi:hypothetical protein